LPYGGEHPANCHERGGQFLFNVPSLAFKLLYCFCSLCFEIVEKSTRVKGAIVTDDTLRKRFERAIEELAKIKKVGTTGQWFWLDNRTKPDMSGH
jgi:hypothetical protein